MTNKPDRCLRACPGTTHTVLVAAIAVCLLAAADAFGCPNCKDAVDTADPDGLNVARGYFYSILIMLAMPFTLAGAFGMYVWREMRRQRPRPVDHGEEPADRAIGRSSAHPTGAAVP